MSEREQGRARERERAREMAGGERERDGADDNNATINHDID